MENNKMKKAAAITGSILSGAVLSVVPFNADASVSADLGTGAEIRAELMNDHLDANTLELTCGDKKAEGKEGEHKCGEGKCGEDAKKAEVDADGKAVEHKCGEGKCGEGKCGDDAKKKETTKDADPEF